ncbi:hypothetical protein NDU88_002069 [Pleurodeles waltl]|uniref:Uncharacterized protein n=1 Tax=Pleurodeles waltl TaxID=8319 RepID=A0AAV7M1C1_PLEWA|nr:hypothetical protein NDU88_002069 [Pleurodeles waltl]
MTLCVSAPKIAPTVVSVTSQVVITFMTEDAIVEVYASGCIPLRAAAQQLARSLAAGGFIAPVLGGLERDVTPTDRRALHWEIRTTS